MFPRLRMWVFAGVLAIGVAAAVPRNVAYLRMLRDDRASAAPCQSMAVAGDNLWSLRCALRIGNWAGVTEVLARLDGSEPVAALLVIEDAESRWTRHDGNGARAALSTIAPAGPYDSRVWYRAGDLYERLGAADEAAQAFDRGAANDPDEPWSEGRYRSAMLLQRRERWAGVVDRLGPLLHEATDADFQRPIQALRRGGPVWQGGFLALGIAYERLGERGPAEATYARIGGLRHPTRDWTLNRTLVALARLREDHGDLANAADAVARALDIASEVDVAERRNYESFTAGDADRLVETARRSGRLPELARLTTELTQRSAASAGAWYVSGLVREAACDLGAARTAYAHARTLLPADAGSHVNARLTPGAGATCQER